MLKKFFFLFILYTLYFILYTSPVFALKFGPHMVCNTNPESFADVREQYNLINGWTGIANKIPATIILQASMTTEQMTEVFIATRDNGIIPYIRLAGPGFWDQICEDDIKKFAVNLNSALQNAGLSGIYVAPGNEVNRDDEWVAAGCGSKIDSLARALNILLDNAQNYKVAFPGLDLYYQGGNWKSFLTEFNNQHHSLLKRLEAFVIHSYTEISDRNPNKWHEEKNFLNSIGIYPKFLFYEANLHPTLNASADEQADYIQNIAFPTYNSDISVEIITPFSRAKPIINYTSADNPYLMLVIKEDGSKAKFIEFPHPADNCGVGPNIILESEIAAGDYIVHKKSIITQILEALSIFIKGGSGFKEGNNFIKTPDLSEAKKLTEKEVSNRLLPFNLQKRMVKSSPENVNTQYSFPVCNAKENEKRNVSGKSQSRLDLTAENFSNALVLNDLLAQKNKNVKKKNPADLYNYAVTFEENEDENFYRCSQPVIAENIKETDVLAEKTKTDWEGEFEENKGVLASQIGPSISPTPTIFQREAKFEIINQAKTKSPLSSFANFFSSGFIKALMPKGLFNFGNEPGATKNTVITETDLEKTEKDLNVVYPRAGEIKKAGETFRKMLLPKAVQ